MAKIIDFKSGRVLANLPSAKTFRNHYAYRFANPKYAGLFAISECRENAIALIKKATKPRKAA